MLTKATDQAQSLEIVRSTIDCARDGILVVDEARIVSGFNAQFVALWNLPQAALEIRNSGELLRFASAMLKNPETFVAQTESIYSSNPPESFDVLEFADGRVVERFSKIQILEGRAMGRVWTFRDVTDRNRAEAELRRQSEWFRVTLSSIGDAVIATDKEARVTFLNPVAETLTGWLSDDAVGRPVDEIFRIINERTSEPAQNPVSMVLSEGKTVALAGHTALISKDGRETAIEDSAAPIRDPAGTITGVVMVFQDVTERRRAQKELRTSHDQFAAILNQAPVGVLLLDSELRFVHVNPKALPTLEGVGELMGRKVKEVLAILWPPNVAADHEMRFRHTLQTGEPYFSNNFSGTRADRNVQEYYDWQIHRVILPDGQPGVVCYFIDISSHVFTEQALRRSEEELRALAASIPNLAWMADASGSIFWYNRGWYDYTGTNLESMQGWGWQSVHEPSMLPLVVERWSASIKTGLPFEMEFPLRGADGTFRWFLTRVNPLLDDQGKVLRWFGTNTDINEVRLAREALQEESRVLDLLNSTGQAIASNLDLKSVVQTVTDAGTALSGAKFGAFFYNVINAKGEALLLYTLSGAPREAFEKFGMPRATPIFSPTFHGEAVVRSADITKDPRYGTMGPHHGMPAGHLAVRSYLAAPVISRSGEVIGGLFFGHSEPGIFTERSERLIVALAVQAAVAIDNARLYEAAQREIAERKVIETELAERASLATLRGDVARSLALSKDINSTLKDCCELFVRHLGAAFARIWVKAPEEEVLLLRASAGLYTHLDGSHARVPIGQFKIGRIAESASPHLTNDVAHDPNISDPEWAKRESMVAFAGFPLIFEGRIMGVLALFSRNVISDAVIGDLPPIADAIAATIERRNAEIELVAAKERAEVASRAKDDFLARLSHELRTPLTPVLMTSAALRDDERLPEDVRRDMAMVERNIGLEARLIDDLLDLTRVTSGKLRLREEVCDAHSLIHLALEIVRDEAQAKPIAVQLDLAAHCTGLRCDPARIQQVFWNLLRNAIKFTPAGGRLIIRSRDQAGQWLRIEFEDTGLGLSAEALESVFKPFEQAGRENDHRYGGVGLGLTIAQAIVDLHGGGIRAESPGMEQGSTFIVELPGATEAIPSANGAEHPANGAAGKSEKQEREEGLRLLVVEDHEPTLAILTRLLKRRGHHVVSASTVAAAVATARVSEFDIVISDLGLPDGTGLELYALLQEIQPSLPGIALSGYGTEEDLQRSEKAGFAVHLTKPVDFEQLNRALRQLREPA